jgi:hypothetical protein
VVPILLLHGRRASGLRADASCRDQAGAAGDPEGRRHLYYCTTDPERAAGFIANRGYTGARDYAAPALREIPYARWHEYDPEDTVRFYALRLHEVGMLKSSPQKLIAQGTDWRFLNELKKELKG